MWTMYLGHMCGLDTSIYSPLGLNASEGLIGNCPISLSSHVDAKLVITGMECKRQ